MPAIGLRVWLCSVIALAPVVSGCDFLFLKHDELDECLATQLHPIEDIPADQRWIDIASLHTSHQYAAVAAAASNIYVLGGLTSGTKNSSSFEVYDVSTDAWSDLSNMSRPRHFLAAAALNGKVYAIGGVGNPTEGDSLDFHSTVEAYDIATGHWGTVPDLPTARNRLVAVAVNGMVYVIGGISPDGNSSAVEAYDPVTDRWEKKAGMPTARHGHAAALLGTKIMVAGGYDDVSGITGVVELYDPESDEWTRLPDLPTPRGFLGLAVAKGYVYAIAGRVGGNPVERFDPCTYKWRILSPLPRSFLNRFGSAVVNDQIYLVGGENQGEDRHDLIPLRYDPDNSR